jgi:hypothetical protein
VAFWLFFFHGRKELHLPLIDVGRNLTTACTRPRIAQPSSARLGRTVVVCAAGDAGRSAARVVLEKMNARLECGSRRAALCQFS